MRPEKLKVKRNYSKRRKMQKRTAKVNTAIRTKGNSDPEEVSSMSVPSSGFGAMHVGSYNCPRQLEGAVTERRKTVKGRVKTWKPKVRRRGPVHL
ncbi:hypothetical protein B7P43_G08742 [Cryptotermes secundus]|uniref:Uncharacterized protein n=1 Tax=Cryptotermes secundus TaxID=105785 RepID=A0A2J7RNQ9_9NEOP|nr:hypothetical protein B7P43_G08742 [Cryptotermes secundus]